MVPENQPSIDLAEKIKSDLQKSGFPLEFHVLNVCSTKNTGRMPGLRYQFRGQERELDLLAFFEEIKIKKSDTLQHTGTSLIIECKKRADKPWVFISSPSYSFPTLTYHLKYASDFDLYFAKTHEHPLFPQIYKKVDKNSYFADQSIPKCISYYEAFKDPKQPSDIYKSIDNVISYLLYRREQRLNLLEEFGTFSDFYLPVVVLDGKLFEASIGPELIRVCERPHVELRTFHLEDIYVIDVVTRDYFSQFFDRAQALHTEIVDAIANLHFDRDFRTRAWLKHEQDWRNWDSRGELEMLLVKRTERKPRRRPRKTIS